MSLLRRVHDDEDAEEERHELGKRAFDLRCVFGVVSLCMYVYEGFKHG